MIADILECMLHNYQCFEILCVAYDLGQDVWAEHIQFALGSVIILKRSEMGTGEKRE